MLRKDTASSGIRKSHPPAQGIGWQIRLAASMPAAIIRPPITGVPCFC